MILRRQNSQSANVLESTLPPPQTSRGSLTSAQKTKGGYSVKWLYNGTWYTFTNDGLSGAAQGTVATEGMVEHINQHGWPTLPIFDCRYTISGGSLSWNNALQYLPSPSVNDGMICLLTTSNKPAMAIAYNGSWYWHTSWFNTGTGASW